MQKSIAAILSGGNGIGHVDRTCEHGAIFTQGKGRVKSFSVVRHLFVDLSDHILL